MVWRRLDFARAVLREQAREWKWSGSYYCAALVDGYPAWFLAFTHGYIVYQWDPEVKELVYWRPVRHENFGNLTLSGRKEAVEMSLRKVTNKPPPFVEVDDKDSRKRWPTLWEHLTARTYDDEAKSPRQTSTVTLFRREDGMLGAILNDKDNARACFSCAASIMGLLDLLEKVASHGDTVWREDRQITGGSKRKK